MTQPTIYQIKPEHVGNNDTMQFLRQSLAKEFDGKEYYITNETTSDRVIPGYNGMRRIVTFGVEIAGENRAVHFDITDVTASKNNINWLGNH